MAKYEGFLKIALGNIRAPKYLAWLMLETSLDTIPSLRTKPCSAEPPFKVIKVDLVFFIHTCSLCHPVSAFMQLLTFS